MSPRIHASRHGSNARRTRAQPIPWRWYFGSTAIGASGVNHSLLGFNPKTAEQDVPDDLTILDGYQGHDDGSTCPQTVYEFRFRITVECLAIQFSDVIVVGGSFLTNERRWHWGRFNIALGWWRKPHHFACRGCPSPPTAAPTGHSVSLRDQSYFVDDAS
jgi:hypothetical protein